MQEEAARLAVVAGIGDADIADRLGIARNLVPDADGGEQALAGIGNRRGAAIEARLRQRGERHAIDQGGGEPRFAGRQRQQAAVEAGTNDDEI